MRCQCRANRPVFALQPGRSWLHSFLARFETQFAVNRLERRRAQNTEDAAASKVRRQKLLARLRPSVPDWRPIAKRAAGAIAAVAAVGDVLSGLTGYWWTYKTVVGELLGHKPAVTSQSKQCADNQAGFPQPLDGPRWNGWGADLNNSRFQPAAMAGLTQDQVPRLQLKWAFGFPGASAANAQPTIVGGLVFVGGGDRKVYALDAKSGCTRWVFATEADVRTAISFAPISGTDQFGVFFGDVDANAYAVNATTGALVWKTKVEDHPAARIIGAPTLYSGVLYVPVSSIEELTGSRPTYQCCTFRGSVAALDAATGRQIWKAYTIPEPPRPTTRNAIGTQLYGPSGAAVWSAPTIDVQRGALYVATGNSYSNPPAETSDAILAFDLATGRMLWHRQATAKDSFVVACFGADKTNCPEDHGPDHDFGQSPILVTLRNGQRELVIGQKSGVVHALDPDQEGKILWQTRIGKGGPLGGIMWGSAADQDRVYVANSDVRFLARRHLASGSQCRRRPVCAGPCQWENLDAGAAGPVW